MKAGISLIQYIGFLKSEITRILIEYLDSFVNLTNEDENENSIDEKFKNSYGLTKKFPEEIHFEKRGFEFRLARF